MKSTLALSPPGTSDANQQMNMKMMIQLKHLSWIGCILTLSAVMTPPLLAQKPNRKVTPEQLARWLKQFPEADENGDGKLTVQEALDYRDEARRLQKKPKRGGKKTAPKFDPGWMETRFPDHAACYKTPDELKALFPKIASFDKPADGALRIVGTGHSFMAPGYRSLPGIVRAAGFAEQPLHLHTSGGVTGSARYKWEQENGIFQFDGKPTPKLLASIANAKWDAMMWGPYIADRARFYGCWIEFCDQHSPGMKFYLSDAWPSIRHMEKPPASEDELTGELIRGIDEQKDAVFEELIGELRETHGDRIFVLPTSEALTLAVEAYHRGELPGIEGIHRAVGKAEENALWRDPLGHLGPGLEWLEGYVFYATLYKKSPALIKSRVGEKGDGFPSRALHDKFREIAWQAVLANPLSGVEDANGDGIGD